MERLGAKGRACSVSVDDLSAWAGSGSVGVLAGSAGLGGGWLREVVVG